MVITSAEMLLRLGSGIVTGGAIGYEREVTGRPAGLRTHLVVALASTTFMLVSTQFVYFQHYAKDDLVSIDTSRIAASVVAGVGFLGAGAILRTGISVQGLTTAASLWLVAALGLAAGAGMYALAGTITVVSLLALTVLRRAEGKQWRLLKRHLMIVIENGTVSREDFVERLREYGASQVLVQNYDRQVKNGKLKIEADIYLPNEQTLDRLLMRLDTLGPVRRLRMQRQST